MQFRIADRVVQGVVKEKAEARRAYEQARSEGRAAAAEFPDSELFVWRNAGHVQSLILASILIVTAVVIYAAGIITDLTAANRTLLEEVRTRLLRAEVERARDESRGAPFETRLR